MEIENQTSSGAPLAAGQYQLLQPTAYLEWYGRLSKPVRVRSFDSHDCWIESETVQIPEGWDTALLLYFGRECVELAGTVVSTAPRNIRIQFHHHSVERLQASNLSFRGHHDV